MFSRSILAAAISLTLMAQAQAAATASSEQIGSENLTNITQQTVANVSAAAYQNGDFNGARIDQKGSELTVGASQQGISNTLDVQQDGWDSSAEVDQVGQSNVATVYQLPFDNAQLSAYIDQNGQGNTSTIRQVVANVSSARTLQDGVNNTADIEQRGQFGSINVDQRGESNTVTATQTAAGADVLQVGNNNNVDLYQYTDSYARTDIEQDGSFNDAQVGQWADGRYGGGSIMLKQQGERNLADVNSGGAWADVDFSQIGTGNRLTVEQSSINAGVTGFSKGDDNSVEITQGDDAYVDIAQEGSENTILVTQTGGIFYNATADNGTVAQTGTGNFASLSQDSSMGDVGTKTASIMQNGANNSATVTQR